MDLSLLVTFTKEIFTLLISLMIGIFKLEISKRETCQRYSHLTQFLSDTIEIVKKTMNFQKNSVPFYSI